MLAGVPYCSAEDFTTFGESALAEVRIDGSPGRKVQIAVFARQRLWGAITARSVLPKPQRDLRLDLFRGLANWLIFLGHIPGSVLAWFTTRNYGFSDGADLFVLISGYTATIVFGKIMLEHGFVIGTTRLLRRVWQLYVAHLLIFLFYLTIVHYISHKFDDPHFMDQFNVATLMNRPVETLSEGLLLKFKPLNLDVLPLYIVLMAAFPIVLWLMLRWRNVVMVGSVGLYLAARHYGWNFTSYPTGVWYFNPLAWQLLFVLGAWLALGGTDTTARILRSRWLYLPCAAFLLAAFGITLAERIPGLLELIPGPLAQLFIPNDKTNLAPYRVAHLASLAFIVVSLIPFDWPGLRWAVFRPLIRCGQQSLPVFCVGLFLSFIAHFIFEIGSANVLVQILVGAAGLCILTIIANYRTWSKQVDKNLAAER